MREVQPLLDRLDGVRAETLKRLALLSQAQLDWRPPVAGGSGEPTWSLGEVFMHLAIDEHYLREQIARPLLEGVKPPDEVLYFPPPPPQGAQNAFEAFPHRQIDALVAARHLQPP